MRTRDNVSRMNVWHRGDVQSMKATGELLLMSSLINEFLARMLNSAELYLILIKWVIQIA